MSFFLIGLVVFIIVTALYLIGFYLSPNQGYQEKLSPYESGFEPLGSARFKFEILYWVIAILYLIFDLEIILIFPFVCSVYIFNSYVGICVLYFFLTVLTLAFIYELKFKALIIK
jgi:NADH:ubiquinone oxidoreductase subunit 3 (subunit A)